MINFLIFGRKEKIILLKSIAVFLLVAKKKKATDVKAASVLYSLLFLYWPFIEFWVNLF